MADTAIFAFPLWLGWWCTRTPNVPLPASVSPRAPSPQFPRIHTPLLYSVAPLPILQ